MLIALHKAAPTAKGNSIRFTCRLADEADPEVWQDVTGCLARINGDDGLCADPRLDEYHSVKWSPKLRAMIVKVLTEGGWYDVLARRRFPESTVWEGKLGS